MSKRVLYEYHLTIEQRDLANLREFLDNALAVWDNDRDAMYALHVAIEAARRTEPTRREVD